MPLVLTADATPGTASWTDFAGRIVAAGQVTITGLSNSFGSGLLPTDIALFTLQSDDTGAPLSSVNGYFILGGTVLFGVDAPPVSGDGVMNVLIIRPG